MAANDSKRYYWLKMYTNFFDNHKLRSLSMYPNGREAQLLYVKLLVETIPHNGELRNSKDSPYTDMMIAGFTYTPVEVVRDAISLLEQVDLIERDEDGTIHFLEMDDLIGSDSGQTYRKSSAGGKLVVSSGYKGGKNLKISTLEYKSIRDKSIRYISPDGESSERARAYAHTREIPDSPIKPYPTDFADITAYLLTRNALPSDTEELYLRFMDLTTGGWLDSKRHPIKDWQSYILKLANKCNQSKSKPTVQKPKPMKEVA